MVLLEGSWLVTGRARARRVDSPKQITKTLNPNLAIAFLEHFLTLLQAPLCVGGSWCVNAYRPESESSYK